MRETNRRQIRVPLARLRELQKAYQDARTRIYRTPHGMDTVQRRQRVYVSLTHRRTLPQDFPCSHPEHVQASIPCLCAYLLPPLPCHHLVGSGTTSQHQLQALCAIY